MATCISNLFDLLKEEESLISKYENLDDEIIRDLHTLEENTVLGDAGIEFIQTRLANARKEKEETNEKINNIRKSIKRMICRILQDY